MIATATATALPGFPLLDSAPHRRVARTIAVKAKNTSSDAATSLELVLRASAGDQTAYTELYARYKPRLQRWAHNRLPLGTRGALQTEDLVQDTLTRVFEHLGTFNPRHEGAFQGYVRTTLLNRIRDLARRHKRRGTPDPLSSGIVALEPSPLDEAIGSETLARYDAALERLRPEERELIIARIEMGLPYPEIAIMFEKPSVPAVHMAVSRALIKLAEEMAHERKR
jgi:RNA polymerase sigma-70 factor, ECF subfamily